ncbi:PP2C family protein-serine/threonine phosphatase [Marinospirillum alkaliphilum]|uniref:Stage II sporulation protein E (SpoIIE) n=1 Tax=Marinospirillum alkaliphilum DSM 21637 TaxID=1122209 RepID=A0A1K1TYV3_9GAMM|nr:SpoIIE family protein phosphatase [Marinospirillum alkaliphilum]SFX05831.1 Stage II sporulation protein E (SpoIIE) [Marinospirillum alkaliphilum DSM 21637]
MSKPEQDAALRCQQLEQENADLRTSLEMLRQDQEAGYHVQKRLLPLNAMEHQGFRLNYWLQPSLYLSGDFLDFWSPKPGKLLFYLADVSGHGASSAFVTILLKYIVSRYAKEDDLSPARLCTRINEELLVGGLDKHLTLVMGCLDTQTRQLTYTLGAHLPVPLMVSDGEVQELEGSGMPIGLFPGAVYKDYTCTFPEKGCLMMASDGVLEVLPGEGLEARQKEWRLRVAASGGDLESLLQRLPGEPDNWPDDVTLMTVSGF